MHSQGCWDLRSLCLPGVWVCLYSTTLHAVLLGFNTDEAFLGRVNFRPSIEKEYQRSHALRTLQAPSLLEAASTTLSLNPD